MTVYKDGPTLAVDTYIRLSTIDRAAEDRKHFVQEASRLGHVKPESHTLNAQRAAVARDAKTNRNRKG